MDDVRFRLGMFFTMVGVLALYLLYPGIKVGEANLPWISAGIFSTALGIYLMTRRQKSEPPQRFRILKKLLGKKESGEEE